MLSMFSKSSMSSTPAFQLWAKRMMATGAADKFDLVVVGGGPGGYVAAIKAGQLGMKVACVEMRGTLGGTCLNVGCIPSKSLLNSSHHYSTANEHFKDIGIEVTGLKVNLEKMMAAKSKAVSGLTTGIAGLFKKNKVTYVIGKGKLTGKNEVTVALNAGGTQVLNTDKILIATGSEPSPLNGVEVDEKTIVTSTGALSLKTIPKDMIVIGAGVIGLELGSVYARLGANVTVVEYLDRVTPGIDLEVANAFQKSLQKQKFKFLMGQKVESAKVSKSGGAEVVFSPVKGGDKQTLKADIVLLATGRRPYTDNLGLDKVGVAMDRMQVKIDSHWKTNVPNIYAIGDVVAGPMLAHKAEEEGIAAVETMKGMAGHVNYNTIPGVIYTHPEVACVGQTEEELKKAGVVYKVGKFPFMANSRARTNDDAEGLVKVITDAKTDKILGVHMMGPNAGELIAEAVLGMEYGASAEDLARTCHAHPTLSEAVKEACMAAYDKPIHF